MLVANKIALGQIDVGIAGGADTACDAPLGLNEDLRKVLLEARRAKSAGAARRSCSASCARARSSPTSRATPSRAPACDGRARRDHRARVGHHPRGAGRARRRQPPAARRRLRPRLLRRPRHARTPGSTRDQNLRPDSTVEKLAKLKPVFGEGEGATMTAGNSTPLTDGAAVVLLASEEWASERSLPVLAHLTHAQTAAVDYVDGEEGLLMAPAYAVPSCSSGPG